MDLDYADGIAAMDYTGEGQQETTDNIGRYSAYEYGGLRMNADTTECMVKEKDIS